MKRKWRGLLVASSVNGPPYLSLSLPPSLSLFLPPSLTHFLTHSLPLSPSLPQSPLPPSPSLPPSLSPTFSRFLERCCRVNLSSLFFTSLQCDTICRTSSTFPTILFPFLFPFFSFICLNLFSSTSIFLGTPLAGSVFWSTLVTWVNGFARIDYLPEDQQYYLSVIILLMFLLILPFIFDTLARNYEGMKLESEIQNAIMTRWEILPLLCALVCGGMRVSDWWTSLITSCLPSPPFR